MHKVLLLSFCLGVVGTDDALPKFVINQTWGQETNYQREVPYKVYGTGGPIIIALHGMGGSGLDWHPLFDNANATALPNGGNFVLVMPTGYIAPGKKASWNVIAEPSTAPDVQFVETIADQAAALADADASVGIGLIGNSNGCGLVQRILIESEKPELKRFVCVSTVLATAQYRTDKFYSKKASYNDSAPAPDWFEPKTQPVPLASGRSLRIVVGTADDKIPLAAGPSKIFKWHPDVEFLGLNGTGLIWSKHFGCTGDEISVSTSSYGSAVTMFQSCSSGPTVAWFKIDGAPHDMLWDNDLGFWVGPNANLQQMVADFFTPEPEPEPEPEPAEGETSKGYVGGISSAILNTLVLCVMSAGSALRRTSS